MLCPAHRCSPLGLRHARSLRGDDEGGRAERVSRCDAGRHRARNSTARCPRRCAGAGRLVSLLSTRDGLSRRRRSRRRLERGAASQPRPATTRFVAPDNGVLTAVFRETPPKRVVELTERKYARPTVSRTFEGRDRFAPAAGWLAKGIALAVARARRSPTTGRSTFPDRWSRMTAWIGESAARRSLRQPDHEHRSARRSTVRARRRRRGARGGARRRRAW